MSEKTLESMNINAETIRAYDHRIPRYTSYPTAPFWTPKFGSAEWQAHLEATSASSRDLSIYVHIPFCRKRCLFCACNVIVTRKSEVVENYIRLMERELELVRSRWKGTGRVIQLHFGGGTPNFLGHDQMARVIRMIEAAFPFSDAAERSIEADPRIATGEDIEWLRRGQKFNRISFGAQDFNEETQKAIGRTQTLDVTFAHVDAARRVGFSGVNIDLIYGLPRQTGKTWTDTLDGVCRLRPDRIALYNFAYLPSKVAHQRVLKEAELPSPALKLEMFIEAHDRFTSEGWEFIGMDHYALKTDSLTRAQGEGTLRRNFMGYTTLRGTDLLGFGVSSISDFQGAFAQNVKKLTAYEELIEAGRLPSELGILLSEEDLIRRAIIEEVMCNGVLRLDGDGARGGRIREIVEEEAERLAPLEQDDLIAREPGALRVTPKGRIFLRNIAVVFDAYMKQTADKPLFSRAV